MVAIAKTLLRKNNALLATRVEPSVARALLRVSKRAVYHEAARVVAIAPPKLVRRGAVLIITAGTADIPVAEEARVTADIMGSKTDTLYDVGVAAACIACWGSRNGCMMPGPSSWWPAWMACFQAWSGGLVRQPVIAVPTSREAALTSAGWPHC